MKIKLRDITQKQFIDWKRKKCKDICCVECKFYQVDCTDSKYNWTQYKDLYSDKFLGQEIEVEVDILTTVEKRFLTDFIEAFREKVIKIRCLSMEFPEGTNVRQLEINVLEFGKYNYYYQLPYIEGWFEGLVLEKDYTLEELGL